MSLFARQMTRSQTPDLSRFVNTDFSHTDPCLNCSLPFDCDETQKGCRYVQITNRRPTLNEQTVDEADRQLMRDIIEILLKI